MISYTGNESKGYVNLLEINAKTGENESSVPIEDLYGHLYYDDYMAMNGDTLYVYNTNSYVAAFNIKNGTMKWLYQAPNPLVYVNRGTLILENNTVYIPVIAKGIIGIIALNASTGRVLWRRGIDHSCGFFRYTFAYSPEYHMIVRVNETGNLIALDSRTGKVLWVVNRTYDGIAMSQTATPVIAKNYIYVYGHGHNLTSEYSNQVTCDILRVYNITTGKIVYQMKLPPVQGEDSLNLPDIAVNNGKVFIPNMYFYVIVHGTTSEKQENDVWYYAAAVVIAIAVIAVGVLVYIRKKN
ncbi:MAG: PQQ-binding-like beta-propeller repeat protein [Euryarchaeota archaeon]|nr:PQQ-binding-like beta-propeller repeat protein [Euryarchaeota archaeon]